MAAFVCSAPIDLTLPKQFLAMPGAKRFPLDALRPARSKPVPAIACYCS